MQTIILSGFTSDDLLLRIEQIIDAKLGSQAQMKNNHATDYITRKEVAKLLKVSLPTLHDWKKLGWIPSYKIGNRLLFKRQEVEAALHQVYTFKHKKGGKP